MKVWKFIKGVLSLGRATLKGRRDLPLLTDRSGENRVLTPVEPTVKETRAKGRKSFRKDR